MDIEITTSPSGGTGKPHPPAIHRRLHKLLVGIFWLLFFLLVTGVPPAYHYLVYAGKAEKVTIHNGEVDLAGVLVKPSTSGPHPAIILLHGAGPQTYNKWFYRIHTNVFVRKGFAVFSYDQRGSGASEGDLQRTGFPDMVGDGLAAVDLLRSRADIISSQIGLMGASESGWYAPEIAARAGDIAFIVNKVAPPLPWITTVLYESKVAGRKADLSEADLETALQLLERIYRYYIAAAADEATAYGPEREAINQELSTLRPLPGVGDLLPASLPDYDRAVYAAKASKYAYDPYPFLAENDVPMLYILAGQDANVPYDESIAVLEQLSGQLGVNIRLQLYPQAGHYLLRWDWFPLEGVYQPGYLELIGSWAADQVGLK